MSTKKVNTNIDKFTSYLSGVPSRFMKAHPLKRAYIILWMITGVLLITFIAVAIAYGGTAISSEINTIAAIGLIFVVSLIASTFTTVIAQKRSKKVKLPDKAKGGK